MSWNAAQPFVKLNENDANWKFKENLKCKPTVVGVMHGSEPETDTRPPIKPSGTITTLSRDGYLQKLGLDVALKEAQATAQSTAAAAPVTAPAAAPAQAPSAPPPVPAAAPAAPPIPADSQWYYAVAGQQRGPVGLETMRELAATGLVSPETNVWCQGMPAWAPAISTPLAALFETATTPLVGPFSIR